MPEMKIGAVLAVCLVANASCGAPRTAPASSRPIATQEPTPAATPTATATPEPASPCNGGGGVIVVAADTTMQCKDEYRQCSAEVPLAVWSCEGPIEVENVEVRRSDSAVMRLTFDEPKVLAGQPLRHTLTLLQEGDYVVVAHVRRAQESEAQGVETRLLVKNPARDAAVEACKACEGQWASWGMTGWEGCNCRTKDAGKTCRDGEECEGACLFERMEVVRQASGPTRVGSASRVTLVLGVPVGRCSEYRMVFGCKTFIRDGASKHPPMTLPARMTSTCVD